MSGSTVPPWNQAFPHLRSDATEGLQVVPDGSATSGHRKQLPLVLAGPILRKVTDTSCAVWVALQAPTKVKLTIETSNSTAGGTGWVDPVSVGANLYIALVEATGLSLSSGTTYFYDLSFQFPDGKPPVVGNASGDVTLGTKGVLDAGTDGLRTINAAENDERPSFALPPPDKNKVRFFHGSCRKPHGEKRGTLSAIRKPIQSNLAEPMERPHALFLTGDQIYGDDVPDTFFSLLWNAGPQLLNTTETVPENETGPRTELGEFTPDHRQTVANNVAKLTADTKDHNYATSHLFGLGEYLAMYLAVWSDAIWPAGSVKDAFPTLEELWDGGSEVPDHVLKSIRDKNGGRYPRQLKDANGKIRENLTLSDLENGPKVAKEVVAERRKKHQDDIERVTFFREEIPDVRRVLANVPTYMMWDDHDVTDDWFLTGEWVENVLSSPLGYTTVQNGMLAANLCQMWGNRPGEYAGSNPGKALLDNLSSYLTRDLSGTASAQLSDLLGIPRREDAKNGDIYAPIRWNRIGVDPDYSPMLKESEVRDWEKQKPKRITYHFGFYPGEYGVGIVDTRTWRAFPSKQATPELISVLGITTQLNDIGEELSGTSWYEHSNAWERSKPLFLVVPVPLWPVQEVDMAQTLAHGKKEVLNMAIKARDVPDDWKDWDLISGHAAFDYEHWRLQTASLEAFISDIAQWSEYVITLSGDVHYGYTNRTELWHNYESQAAQHSKSTTRFANLTASAGKNETMLTHFLHRAGYVKSRAYGYGGWHDSTEDRPPLQIAIWRTLIDGRNWSLQTIGKPFLGLGDWLAQPGPGELLDRYVIEQANGQAPKSNLAHKIHYLFENVDKNPLLKRSVQASLAAPWNAGKIERQIITTEFHIEGTGIDTLGLVDAATIWWEQLETQLVEVPIFKFTLPTGSWSLSDGVPMLETIEDGEISIKKVKGDLMLHAKVPHQHYLIALMRHAEIEKRASYLVERVTGKPIPTDQIQNAVEKLDQGWKIWPTFGDSGPDLSASGDWIFKKLDDALKQAGYAGTREFVADTTKGLADKFTRKYNDWAQSFVSLLQGGVKPDWEYRVDYVQGTPNTDASMAPSGSNDPADPIDPADEWRDFKRSGSHGREVVGRNNVGEVRLDFGDATYPSLTPPLTDSWRTVTHRLWWRMGGTAEAHPYTEFTVNMEENALGLGGPSGVHPTPTSTVPPSDASSRPSDLIQDATSVERSEEPNV